MELEEKLSILRRQKGYSQQELAEHLNVSRQAVSMWESGATFPSTDNLYLLSRLYGVTIDEILDRTPLKDEAETKAEEQPEKKKLRGRLLAAAALLLAALAIAVSAYLLGRGESDDLIIDSDDMEGEPITDIEDIGSVPWEME